MVEEVAGLTGRSECTIRRWITEGKLKAVRIAEGRPRGRLLVRAANSTNSSPAAAGPSPGIRRASDGPSLLQNRKVRAALTEWVADGKLDLVQGTLLKVKQRLQSQTEYDAARGDEAAWGNLGRLMKDQPGDLREEAEAFFREREYDVPALTGRAK